MFKVMVDIWTGKGYVYGDYISGEYSGIEHSTRDAAENELREAEKEFGTDDCWIRKVG